MTESDGGDAMNPNVRTLRHNGKDRTSFATVDADGVAVAAIRGLDAKLNAENAALQSRSAAREAMQAHILNALDSNRPFATD